jgi:hypothetical protein
MSLDPARVREQVRASRRAQGLPETVTADRFLDQLAAEVLVDPPEPVRYERVRLHDDAA